MSVNGFLSLYVGPALSCRLRLGYTSPLARKTAEIGSSAPTMPSVLTKQTRFYLQKMELHLLIVFVHVSESKLHKSHNKLAEAFGVNRKFI